MENQLLEKALALKERVDVYTLLSKTLHASGVLSLLSPTVQERIKGDSELIEGLTADIMPAIDAKLEQAKNDFDKL